MHVYIGCYTRQAQDASTGILTYATDDDGLLRTDPVPAPGPNPTFLAVRGTILYATHETAPGRIASYRRGPHGLTPVASAGTGGAGPGHVAVAHDGRYLMVVNYGSGTVAAIATDMHGGLGPAAVWHATGAGPHPERQRGPHPHQAVQLPNDHWLVADLGTDTITELRHHHNGTLSDVGRYALPPGCGPRHLVVDGEWLYVAGELDSRVHALRRHEGGYRWQWSVPSVDPDQNIPCETNDPSHIELSPDRDRLYIANRGRDTISTFEVLPLHPDGARTLTLRQEAGTRGHWPRHFAVRDGRCYIANQRSNRVCVFAVDRPGTLGDLLQVVDVAEPACVLLD